MYAHRGYHLSTVRQILERGCITIWSAIAFTNNLKFSRFQIFIFIQALRTMMSSVPLSSSGEHGRELRHWVHHWTVCVDNQLACSVGPPALRVPAGYVKLKYVVSPTSSQRRQATLRMACGLHCGFEPRTGIRKKGAGHVLGPSRRKSKLTFSRTKLDIYSNQIERAIHKIHNYLRRSHDT